MAEVPVEVRQDDSIGLGYPEKEHCSADPVLLALIGRARGHQIRLKRSPTSYALYTVSRAPVRTADEIVLVNSTGLGRTGASSGFRGTMESQVVHPRSNDSTYTDAMARGATEFVERLADNGRHRQLIVIAPHGGNIEVATDDQAERVREKLRSQCISMWVCKGWGDSTLNAFTRWHITSIDIHQASFAALGRVLGRAAPWPFRYAVAFHGVSRERVADEHRAYTASEDVHNYVCIGGRANNAELVGEFELIRRELKVWIQDELRRTGLSPSSFRIDTAECPESFNGDHPSNIVNRLGQIGIHIEQTLDLRENHSEIVANAVAAVLGPRIRVCTAPVFRGIGWPVLCLVLRWFSWFFFWYRWLPPETALGCYVRRMLFRFANCGEGNSDPCIELD